MRLVKLEVEFEIPDSVDPGGMQEDIEMYIGGTWGLVDLINMEILSGPPTDDSMIAQPRIEDPLEPQELE